MPVLPADAPTVDLTACGRILRADPEASAALGGAKWLADWVAPSDREATEAVLDRLARGEMEEAVFQVAAADGGPAWLALRASGEGRVEGRLRPDLRRRTPEPQAVTDRLRFITAITAQGALPFSERLQHALAATSTLLGLELAIVSRIEDETYTVHRSHTPNGEIEPGAAFDLGDTFCSITVRARDLLAVNAIGASPHRRHPCYSLFGIESYIGIPLEVRGEVWGTLSFSSKQAREEPLMIADHDLVRLLALWIGGELEQEQDRTALSESEQRYRALSEATFEAIAFSDGGRVLEANSQFIRLFGYDTLDEVVGMQASAFCAPQSIRLVARMITEGREEPYEALLMRRDGTTFWGEIRGRQSMLRGRPVRVTAIHDVTRRHELSERLRHQATHDSLTGLPNRALFHEHMERALASGEPFAVLFVDLDHFKVVNDSLGHEAGDYLLAVVCERLREAMGAFEGAIVARLGGDEFGLVIPSADEETGPRAARAMLDALRRPVDLGPRTVTPEASVGVVAQAEAYETPEDVLRDADTAMYAAKDAGRGDVEVFAPEMHQAATDRFRLEHDLRRAIEEDEFRVFLQPVVDLASGEAVGHEALVRWEHPERGLLAPGAFIGVAEEVGLVGDIDAWMLRATCQHVQRHGDPEREWVWLSVNCSDQSFLRKDFPQRVREALREVGLRPDRLTLELTERAIVDPENARDALAALHAEGVQVGIDDFGAGYSSLGLLHALPVNSIKIDRTFVADLGRSDAADAIVRAVIGIARDLGLRVVAEGVETERQREALLAAGCALGQGYLFARPVPAAEALAEA